MPMHHDQPDPNVCPRCSARDSISEHANRLTWQPIEQLGYDDVGQLVALEWGMFETADETDGETYYCRECGDEWPTLSALAAAQRLTLALTDHRDFWETRAERLKDLANADPPRHRERGREDRVRRRNGARVRARARNPARER